ncbi:MAG: GAF domain-containing protein [Ardenticatenaceae bacterium]|nr:GAF domain-containing protein [Ardenticatenaceae bacterium]
MDKQLTPTITWQFLDNLNEGIIIVTPDGLIEYINPSAKNWLGLNDLVSLPDHFAHFGISDKEWKKLKSGSGHKTTLALASGVVTLESHYWQEYEGNLLQILVNPVLSEIDASIEHLTTLTRISNEPNFDNKLQLIVDGLRSVGWERVILSLRDAQFKPTKLIGSGFSPAEMQHLAQNMLPAAAWIDLFDNELYQQFRRGSCYFVPEESTWLRGYLDRIIPDQQGTNTDAQGWHPLDVLCVPLYNQRQERIGLIGLDRPKNGRRPTPQVLQIIELYAQFAASAIEITQIVQETLGRTQGLELLIEASNTISGILDRDTLLTQTSQYMLQVAQAQGYTIYQWHPIERHLTVIEDYSQIAHTRNLRPGTILQDDQILQIGTNFEPLVRQIQGSATPLIHQPTWLKESYTTILLPLTLSEEIYGFIQLFNHLEHQVIDQNQLQLLIALSNQTSAALETVLIFEDTYEREQFYNALGSVTLALNYTLNLQTILNLICRESLQIFNADGAYIWQQDGGQLIGSAAQGANEKEFIGRTISVQKHNSFVNNVIRRGGPTFINNFNQVDAIHLELPQNDTIQAVLGVPLEQEGQIIGVLILVDRNNPNHFSDKDLTKASLFGVQAAIALQNAKLFEGLRQFNEELDSRVAERTRALNEESTRVKILLRITSELSASLDQGRVLNQALDLVNEVVNATQGVILLIDQETDELVFRASFGDDRPMPPQGIPSGMMRGEGLAGWMIDNRSPVIVHDTNDDPRWIERDTSRNIRSVLAVPLISSEEVIGVLMLFHARPSAFTSQQLDLVEAAAIQVANAINNANLYLLIRDQAERMGRLLREAQVEAAKSQAILESIADGVLVADAHSEITLVNRAITTILNMPRQELVGKSVKELLGLYDHSADTWIATLEDWSKNADIINQLTVLEDRLIFEEKVVSVHLSPVFVGNSFFGTVSVFRDITKEVEVENLKSEFVSTVSHELRTPMTSIKGYADLMLMGAAGTLTTPQTRYLQVIKSNADRLHDLVNDLLDISRIETGKTKLDLRPLDIPQIVNQIINEHVQGLMQAEDKQMQISVEMSSSLPLVNGDQTAVIQILTNLLDNAFNYTPEGGKIQIAAKARDNFVDISIKDTGIGISPENQAKIFDRFFRADDHIVQQVRGTGLGLAIVRALIEMHGGTLTVESTPNIGSTFTFNLPVVVEDGDEPA